jgi:cation diffusion facilitator CzcD-associated flavoprotein CzcO
LGANLKQVGVETLIVDKNARVGDSWRNRYHQLVLHDPVWYDHLPYIAFPSYWPVFTPKDKLGDWFESYANALELNVWTKTTIASSTWDATKKQWTVDLVTEKDGKQVMRTTQFKLKYQANIILGTLHPKHIVQATGHSGEKNFPSHIKGIDSFKGDVLCHSSEFKGARQGAEGKNAVIVGCCNSAHDIAQDYYENGYNVTMIQRSTTCVLSSAAVTNILLRGVYEEGGVSVNFISLCSLLTSQ